MTATHGPWTPRTKRRVLAFAFSALVVVGASVLFDPEATPSRSAVASSDELRAALRQAEARHGPSSLEVAELIHQLVSALLAGTRKDPDEATQLAERGVAIRESLFGPDSGEVADGLEDAAFAMWQRAELWGASHKGELPLVERALAIRERATPEDEGAVVRDLHFLSETLRVEGEVGDALLIRQRMEPVIKRLHGADSEEMAFHLTRLAALQEMTGDYKRAVASARQAVSIRDRNLPFDDPRVAESLNAWGDLLLKVNDLSGAERAFERAIAISRAQPSPDPAALARVREHLGEALVERGEWEAARRQFEWALGLRRQRYGAEHVLVARALERLGAVERLLGRAQDARVHLSAAIAAQQRAAAVTRPELARSLKELALLEWSEGRPSEALDAALRAESISREHFQFTAGGLSEREALAQARARERGLDLATTAGLALADRGELSPQQALRLFDEVIRSRALVLDTVVSRRRVLGVHPDARTASLVGDLLRARRRATKAPSEAVADGADAGPDALGDAASAAERAERSLAASSVEFREELARQRTGVAEVYEALPQDSALVSFVRYVEEPREAARRGEARYAVLVLRADRAVPRLIALGPARRIDGAVSAWQRNASGDPRLQRSSDPVAAYLRVAGELATEIWRPVATELDGIARVIVARDGAAQRVSFATLPSAEGEYLVAAGPAISYVGAERDLVAASLGVASPRSLLAVGDPAFGDGAAAFDPLPGARSEVAEIASLWPSADPTIVLTGTAADEAAVKRLAPSCGVLHFATHAFDDTATCEGGEGNSLRCTGLALAGANRALGLKASPPGDDGVLSADEIALLDLHRVEWAVLSACASGRGAIEAGEGILGLERAFRIAGARNVVASLWPVEDDATHAWMRELYAARRAGASTAESVRFAALALLDGQRRRGGTTHPYGWGGFIAVGDGH